MSLDRSVLKIVRQSLGTHDASGREVCILYDGKDGEVCAGEIRTKMGGARMGDSDRGERRPGIEGSQHGMGGQLLAVLKQQRTSEGRDE